MKKFIGEMSFDEFKEALKIIFEKEQDIEKEEKKSFKEKMQGFYTELADTFKYFFSFEPIKDLWESIVDCYKFIKYIFSKQCYIDLKNKTVSYFKQPLTKEEFIKRGKIF